jgi:hypothetical protein
VLDHKLLLEPARRLLKPRCARARHGPGLQRAPLLKHPAALAQPGPPTMGAGTKPRRVELDRHTLRRLRPRLPVVPARPLALELLLGLAQRGAPPRPRPKMLRQLIAARLAVELVLAPIRLRRPGQDLARDLLIAAIGSPRGVRGDLRPVDRDSPDPDQPALRQSERTDVNNSASAASWRTRNSAIVE